MKRALASILLPVALLAAPALDAQTGNIDPNERHAWAENAGWLDFRPDFVGATVLPTHLTGWAWSEAAGWVKLGTDGSGPYANDASPATWGVNLNSVTGVLSGFAWSESAGWIRMDPAFGGVTWDGLTKKLSGWAWSESHGWIHFRSTTPTAYGVAVACGSLTGTVTGGGTVCTGSSSTVTVTVSGGAAPYSVTLDSGGGTQSGTGPVFDFTVSPSSTTTYSVLSLADALSCAGSGSGSATVTVNEVPGTPAPTNDGPACEGGTVQLSVGLVPGATYAWTGPAGFTSAEMLPTLTNVTSAMAGDYSVTVTAGGCTSAPGTTTVVVNARPATPIVDAPATAIPNTTFTASVPANAGSTYAWTVLGGTLDSGDGTAEVTVRATWDDPVTLKVVETNASGCASAEATENVAVELPPGATAFHTLTPCRVVNTRRTDFPAGLGAPSIEPAGSADREFDLTAGTCGIPATAIAVALNVTVAETQGAGYLTLYPGDAAAPATSTINFAAGQVKANNVFLPLATDGSGSIKVRSGAVGPLNLLIDVVGYFE